MLARHSPAAPDNRLARRYNKARGCDAPAGGKSMSSKFWIAAGAVLAAVAVTAGAVGTHVLKETLELPESDLETYDIAVRYQMYHALALLLVGSLAARQPSRWLSAAAALFLLGIVLFSGGLYAWLASGVTMFVQVVPLGGFAWIVGWLVLALGAALSPSVGR
jgi:uncharacterized membrane protein YgdD (TMEM256/DUF423 family)